MLLLIQATALFVLGAQPLMPAVQTVQDEAKVISGILPVKSSIPGLTIDAAMTNVGSSFDLPSGKSARKGRARLRSEDGASLVDVLVVVYESISDAKSRFAEIKRTVPAPSLLTKVSTTGVKFGDECWFHGSDSTVSFRLGRVFCTVLPNYRLSSDDRNREARVDRAGMQIANEVERLILKQPTLSGRKGS
ncbi:MAG: hypothetical protein ABIV13_00660 [Fimbriimonadales bacterium]